MVPSVILLLIVAVAAKENAFHPSPDWISFKTVHGKIYASIEEETTRYGIYADNLGFIENHNKEYVAGRKSFQLGMNRFGDWTNDEFKAKMNGYKRPATNTSSNLFVAPNNVAIPDWVDWSQQGLVTPVKDQGQCGSCWAFSATGSLEGQNKKYTGNLNSLSEQNLIDCSQNFGTAGCNGGNMEGAFDYIKANRGIDTEDSYPYEAQDGQCRFNPANTGASDSGHVSIQSGSEGDLEAAIATVGPISVAIDASQRSFQLYSSGVYNEPSCSTTQLDHGVLAVGYSTSNGQKCYIVKNSWGQGWGSGGYILMSRDQNNQCGIATDASYPQPGDGRFWSELKWINIGVTGPFKMILYEDDYDDDFM